MRNRRWMLAGVVLVVVGSALLAADRPPAAHFEFELQRTSTGVALRNHYGGDWISLTGRCSNAQQTCSFVVNERGIQTVPDGQPNPGSR
jgi:hypothetical protein